MFTFEKAAKSLFAAESLKYLSMYKKSQKPTIFIYLLPHKTEKYNTNLIRFCCFQKRPILKNDLKKKDLEKIKSCVTSHNLVNLDLASVVHSALAQFWQIPITSSMLET